MPALNLLSDRELIHSLRNGDREAFTEIYKRYAESLAGFAASKLYNLDDACDVLHDLFVKLWEDRYTLTVNDNLKSFLFAAIRYKIIDKIRRNITREEYAAMLQSLTNAHQPDIEQQITAKELHRHIEKALNELSPKVKEIYHLSREENLSISEIAQKLGLSEQTVKNQLSTALAHLRKTLSGISISILLLWWLS